MAAPDVFVNDWIEVNLVGRYHSQTCITTHHYKFVSKDDEAGALTLEDIGDQFIIDFWTGAFPNYRTAMSVNYALTAVTAQVVSPVRSIMWPTAPPAGSAAGGTAGSSLPSGVAAVLRRRGNIGDRHNYGRVYVPGLPVSYVVDSKLTQLAKDALQPVVDLITRDQTVPMNVGTALLRPYVFNKLVPNNSRVVTHGMVDDVVRYQRRREVGVGI